MVVIDIDPCSTVSDSFKSGIKEVDKIASKVGQEINKVKGNLEKEIKNAINGYNTQIISIETGFNSAINSMNELITRVKSITGIIASFLQGNVFKTAWLLLLGAISQAGPFVLLMIFAALLFGLLLFIGTIYNIYSLFKW